MSSTTNTTTTNQTDLLRQADLLRQEKEEKIINLLKQLLTHYEQLETECSDNETKYYCHTEFDSHVTKFEGLSNSNKIVVKTKLHPKY